MPEPRSTGRRRWIVAVGLLGIVLLAFYVRFDSLATWLERPERYFFADGSTPLLLGVDGYYYLDIARQLQEGAYVPFDPRRRHPAGFERTATPPLLSVALAAIAGLTSAPLEWVAILLPPFLGALLAIPVFLLAHALARRARPPWLRTNDRAAAANAMGLAAAALAVLSPFMVARSGIGWFETDALNVSFAVLAAYLALRYAEESNARRRHAWFGAWAVNLLLYLWWWEQSHVPVFALAGLPMLVAVIHVGWRAWRDLLPLGIGFVLLLAALALWRGPEIIDPIGYWQRLAGTLGYITDDTRDSAFAAAGLDVSEQRRVPLGRLAVDGAGGRLAFAGALLGLAWLAVSLRYRVLYVAALGVVAALSLVGSRFLIFTAPLFGLGLGFLVFVLWGRAWALHWRVGTAVALLVAGAWGAVEKLRSYDQLVPRRAPVLFDAMAAIADSTPDDAVIWASWGHGHPMIFYGDRATIADGIYHPAEVSYMLAAPLASDSPRLSANWMAFGAAHGVAGFREANRLLADGPDDWKNGMARLRQLLSAGPVASRALLLAEAGQADTGETGALLKFLFPGSKRPLFLFLDYLLLEEDWYARGAWRFTEPGTTGHKPYLLIRDIKAVNEKTLRGSSRAGSITIALDSGLVEFDQGSIRLGRLSSLDGQTLRRAVFDERHDSVVSILKDARFGVFTFRDLAATLLHQLYFEFNFDERLFRPFAIGRPYFAVWEVHGEVYAPDPDAAGRDRTP